MTHELWTEVDDYLTEIVVRPDEQLTGTQHRAQDAGLPEIAVAPNQGKLLQLLALVLGARNILEIGTLAGYSAIWLARALPPDGRLITLEIDQRHADVAAENLARAGLTDRVEVRVGPALQTLPRLAEEGRGPFDLIFVDADKQNNPEYLRWALRLSRRGSLIVVDNVVRAGAIVDPASGNPETAATRRLIELLGAEPRLCATVIQTVGRKGHDGIAFALVTGD